MNYSNKMGENERSEQDRSVASDNRKAPQDLWLAREAVKSKLAVVGLVIFYLSIFAVLWEVGR